MLHTQSSAATHFCSLSHGGEGLLPADRPCGYIAATPEQKQPGNPPHCVLTHMLASTPECSQLPWDVSSVIAGTLGSAGSSVDSHAHDVPPVVLHEALVLLQLLSQEAPLHLLLQRLCIQPGRGLMLGGIGGRRRGQQTRVFSRVAAGFLSYNGEYRFPLVLAQGSPIFHSSCDFFNASRGPSPLP